MAKKIFGILLGYLLVLTVGISLAHAGPFDKALGKLTTVGQPTELPPDLTSTVASVINAVLSTVGTVFFVLTVYAGYLWMTASGDEEKVSKARSIVTTAVIGLIVVISAYAITYFVTSKLGGAAPTTTGYLKATPLTHHAYYI